MSTEIVSIDGELSALHEGRVSVLDHSFLYGDGVFEGLRFSPDGILLHHEHFARLARSADRVRISLPTLAVYEQRLADAIAASQLASGYIRVVLSRGSGTLGIKPTDCKGARLVVVVARLALYSRALYLSGLRTVVAGTRRLPRACFDGQIKACNYLVNIMASLEYLDRGASEAIMLDHEGNVSEATVANVFGIAGDRLFTPSLDTNCLRGITRDKVLAIAVEQGFVIEEARFPPARLCEAAEVFLTGTGAGIIAVSQIDGQPIGNGRMGPQTERLRRAYEARIPSWSTQLTPGATRA